MTTETKENFVSTKAIGEKETMALKLEQSAEAVEAQEKAEARPIPMRPPRWRDKLQRRQWKQLSGPRLLSNKRERPRRSKRNEPRKQRFNVVACNSVPRHEAGVLKFGSRYV